MITQVECSAHAHRRWQFSETHGTTVKFVLNLCSATGHGPSVHRCNVCYACLLFFRGVFQFCVPPILEKSSQPECAGRGNRFAVLFQFSCARLRFCCAHLHLLRPSNLGHTRHAHCRNVCESPNEQKSLRSSDLCKLYFKNRAGSRLFLERKVNKNLMAEECAIGAI